MRVCDVCKSAIFNRKFEIVLTKEMYGDYDDENIDLCEKCFTKVYATLSNRIGELKQIAEEGKRYHVEREGKDDDDN